MESTSDILNHILSTPPSAGHTIAYNYLVPNTRGLENMLSILKAKASAPAKSTATTTEKGPITSTQNPNEMPSSDLGERDSEGSQAHTTTPKPDVEISLFAAATESFSKANTNCTIQESLDRCRPIITLAKSSNLRVRGYVSVALGCPYEGPNVSAARVANITATLLEMGADEVSVADTTGMGTVPKTMDLLRALTAAGIAHGDLALHFHDTYGQALVNTVVGLEHGIRTFDSSVGGLGGCPYSKGATGNVATEDLVHTLHSLGIETGVDLDKMADIGAWITNELKRPNDSRAGKASLARRKTD